MKLALLGASVTAQTISHETGELTGYAEALRRHHLTELGIEAARQFAYPGNRLSDGGIVRLYDVLAWSPDICLVEPMVEDRARGEDATNAEIVHVYATLANAGILPVPLFLPVPRLRSPSRSPNYQQHIGIAGRIGLDPIEVEIADDEYDETLFSGPHTTRISAERYAGQIATHLKDMIGTRPPKITVPDEMAIHIGRLVRAWPKTTRQMSFSVTTDAPCSIKIVQLQRVGPFSPIIDVSMTTGHGVSTCSRSIWDNYCHYERQSYAVLFSGQIADGKTSFDLRCSDRTPDHSTARRVLQQWPPAEEKNLQPVGNLFSVSDRPVRLSQVD